MISSSAWSLRLGAFGPLSADDDGLLRSLIASPDYFGSNIEVTSSIGPCKRVLVMVQGLACRSRILPNGRRQILSYLFAGDMGSPQRLLLNKQDESVCTLAPSRIASLDMAAVQALDGRRSIREAMQLYSLERLAIAGEWLLNVGIRSALKRLSHMICEIFLRLKGVGLTDRRTFALQLTQSQLADSLGLSSVHVNRMFMELRRRNVIGYQRGILAILDLAGLAKIAGFDAAYLTPPEHAGQAGDRDAAAPLHEQLGNGAFRGDDRAS